MPRPAPSSAPSAPFVVHAIHHSGRAGSDIAAALQSATAAASVHNVQWTNDLSAASRAVIILTAEVLSDASSPSGAAIERVIRQGVPYFVFVYKAAPTGEGGWEFGGTEQESASGEFKNALASHEAMTYRPPGIALDYEHRAMVVELFRRLARSSP